MTTTHKRRRVPEHLRGFTFERGQAVLILERPKTLTKGHMSAIPGVVANAGEYFITVQTDSGPRRVQPTDLHHRGYCPLCEVAAHLEDGELVCPRCEGASLEGVPDRLLPEWGVHDQYIVCLQRTMLRHGCTQRDAYPILDGQRRERWNAMLEHLGLTESYQRDRFWFAEGTHDVNEGMHSAAARGDVNAFLDGVEQLKHMALGRVIYQLIRLLDEQEVQPTRPAGDCEPDGADELTAWLDQQFRKAA